MNPKDQTPVAGKGRYERHCTSCGEPFLGYAETPICKVCEDAGFEGEVTPPVGEPDIQSNENIDVPSPVQSEEREDIQFDESDTARAMAVYGGLQPHIEDALNQAWQDGYAKGRASRGADIREPSELSKKISEAINALSRENKSDTPDFILGEGLEDILTVLEQIIERRETWYGRKSTHAK